MSRVQLGGEPDPLYTAAGQRSAPNRQSPWREGVCAHVVFEQSCDVANKMRTSTTNVFLPKKSLDLCLPTSVHEFTETANAVNSNSHCSRVYTATYWPNSALALNENLISLCHLVLKVEQSAGALTCTGWHKSLLQRVQLCGPAHSRLQYFEPDRCYINIRVCFFSALSKGPPIILISPEDTTLNMSQDAVLQCQADAYPSNLTYQWLKQGQNVYHIE